MISLETRSWSSPLISMDQSCAWSLRQSLIFDFLHDSLHPEPDLKPFEFSSYSAAVATATIMKMRACLIRLS